MEPGHEDREYLDPPVQVAEDVIASMEPGHEDREYQLHLNMHVPGQAASMEPGHEDREYRYSSGPAWKPRPASMEPGHEDREYWTALSGARVGFKPQWSPVMKTGNTRAPSTRTRPDHCLNGARS